MSSQVKFTLSKKQLEAWRYLTDTKTRSVGYGGGARGGKTRLGCMWLYAMCCAYPGITMFMGRKTLVDLRRTTVIEFYKMLKDIGVSNCTMYNNSEIRFTNGSKILLLDLAYQPSDPHASSLDGLVLQGGLIDEANEIHDSVISTLYTRVMADNRYQELYPRILETFNPDKGRVYSKFYLPYKNQEVPENVAFIPALAVDNPYCEVGYVDSILASGDEMAIQRKVYGNFEYDDSPDALIRYNELEKCLANSSSVQVGIPYMSIDIAASGRDKTVIAIWDGMRLVEVYSEGFTTVDTLKLNIERLKSKYSIPNMNIIMDASGVGALIPSMYQGSVSFFGNGRAMQGFNNLRSECYYKLSKAISDGTICLDGVGTYKDVLFRELCNIKLDRRDLDVIKIQSKDEIKNVLGTSPDFADAVMMRIYFEISDYKHVKHYTNVK